jgi:membrane protein implicated in regulation of membrane protease activity
VDASSFFLIVFLVSLGLTLASFVLGFAGHTLPGLHAFGHGAAHGVHPGVHAPVGVHGGAHIPTATNGGVHVSANGVHAAPHVGGHVAGAEEGISPFNMASLLAFFTWFGGAGYILTAYFGLLTIVAAAGATVAGLIGGGIVFVVLARVLMPNQTPYLDSADYELIGTVGHLSVAIRPGGTGELIYLKAGTRRVASARSDDDTSIERGAEVVVVREERGTAYVRTFEELMEAPAEAGR